MQTVNFIIVTLLVYNNLTKTKFVFINIYSDYNILTDLQTQFLTAIFFCLTLISVYSLLYSIFFGDFSQTITSQAKKNFQV